MTHSNITEKFSNSWQEMHLHTTSLPQLNDSPDSTFPLVELDALLNVANIRIDEK